MSNIRSTAAALLSTVDTTATTFTNAIGGVGRGAAMFDSWVREAQKKQAIRIAIEEEDYEHAMLTQAALKQAEQEEEIQRKLDSNADLKTKFEQRYKKLEDALQTKKAAL